jgi:hypothetical protein
MENMVVADLLLIPKIDQYPRLTKKIKREFSKAGRKIKEIIKCFNSLPGVKIEIKAENSNPEYLFELCIPTDNNFLTGKCEEKEAVIDVGLGKSRISYFDATQGNNCENVSQVYEKWQSKYFIRGKYEDYYSTDLKINELFSAVQELIDSYLNGLRK